MKKKKLLFRHVQFKLLLKSIQRWLQLLHVSISTTQSFVFLRHRVALKTLLRFYVRKACYVGGLVPALCSTTLTIDLVSLRGTSKHWEAERLSKLWITYTANVTLLLSPQSLKISKTILAPWFEKTSQSANPVTPLYCRRFRIRETFYYFFL